MTLKYRVNKNLSVITEPMEFKSLSSLLLLWMIGQSGISNVTLVDANTDPIDIIESHKGKDQTAN